MWFAVGLISLIVILGCQIRYRWYLPWSGTEGAPLSGIRYQYRYLSYKGNTWGVEIGVQVPGYFRFELKRERWMDRFFKWVGLSVEKQFGHEGFDRLVYVASDDDHLHNKVADSLELRRGAQRIFLDASAGCRVQRVICANGRLVARIRRDGLFSSKDDVSRLTRNQFVVLPLLEEIAKALRSSERPAHPVSRSDPFLLRSVVLTSIHTALGLNGLLFLLRPWLFDSAFLIDKARIFELTLVTGSVIFGLLFTAHMLFLARSARAHLLLLELLLVGSFGAFSTAASELRDANMEWDASVPVLREAAVVRKSISHSRKGGTRYFLHVKDWDDSFETRSIKVSRQFYEAIAPSRVLVFEERAGYFQARWAQLKGAKPL
jgi:hypothetical protein